VQHAVARVTGIGLRVPRHGVNDRVRVGFDEWLGDGQEDGGARA
jgi:hypothetical protein